MLIKNTDGSYCKIKETKVSGLKAYVTLVIYSSVPQTSEDKLGNVHRVFSFYLRDVGSTELYKLSHNNYWIDRNNNYNNDSNNVDINMHKEIILEIDITNNNQSEMQENRWLRKCNIVILDHTTGADEAWVSEDLVLISKEIELPTLTNLKINTGKDNILTVSFKYKYESQEDFNYINENLNTIIEIKSVYSRETLETCEFPHYLNENTQEETIMFNSIHEYTEPIIINIYIKNLKGDVLQHSSNFFNPLINNTNLTFKGTTLHTIKSVSIKDTTIKTVSHITNK